jgi:hypothetical protein
MAWGRKILTTRSLGVACALAAFCGGSLTAGSSQDGEPPETPALSEAIRTAWLRTNIVAGRIAVSTSRSGATSAQSDAQGRSERLDIQCAPGGYPVVHYEMSNSEEELCLDISGGGEIRVRRVPSKDSAGEPIEFVQSADEPVLLTVGSGSRSAVYRAPSVWHLTVMHPQLCREQLIPTLKIFCRYWNLSLVADDVESALLRGAQIWELPDRRRWDELVGQLAESRFSRREAADRELRAAGRIVLWYLEQLHRAELDAEQHYRLHRITAALSGDPAVDFDTPERIGAWLAGDPEVWLSLLDRDDEATRRTALYWLEALLGEPVLFDPAAPATIRQTQLERLRAKLMDHYELKNR